MRQATEMLAGAGVPAPGLTASARGAVRPFYAMELLRAAGALKAAGRDVVFLCIGQPAVGAPAAVRAAAAAAMENSVLGYTDALGLLPLRERIGGFYRERYGVEVAAERVVVTTGSSGAFLLAFLAAFDAGARIAVARPGYPPYTAIQQALNLEAVPVDVDARTGFQLSADHVEALARSAEGLQGVMVASPANPTGSMLSPEALAALVARSEALGVRVISDEIYHGVTFGKPVATALQTSDQAIVINSFSKYFCLTGWRLGWMVLPPALVRPVEALAQSFFISPPTISQEAAIAAFDCLDDYDQIVAGYAKNRALLLEELPKIGLTRCAPADGAFYLYVDVSDYTDDSMAFSERMLDEIAVAVTPGVDFDTENGHHFIRLSFAGSEADMRKALDRIGGWLKTLKR